MEENISKLNLSTNSQWRLPSVGILFVVCFLSVVYYEFWLSQSSASFRSESVQNKSVYTGLTIHPMIPPSPANRMEACDISLKNAVAGYMGSTYTNPLLAYREESSDALRYFSYEISFPRSKGDLMQVLSTLKSTGEKTCVPNPSLVSLVTKCGMNPAQLLNGKMRLPGSQPYDRCSITLPNCRVEDYLSKDEMVPTVTRFEDPVFILSLDTDNLAPMVETLNKAELNNVHGIAGVNGKKVFEFCKRPSLQNNWRSTKGELGIRQSFQRAFYRALVEGHERVFIVEDDVMLSDDFSTKFHEILNDPECGGHLYSEHGGVLLLGASDYGLRDRLKSKRYDPWFPKTSKRHPKIAKCYNVNAYTYGAFAAIYHRNVFIPILQWLEDPNFQMFPVDHMFSYLSLKGFIVKVAYSYLALANTLHASGSSGITRRRVNNLSNIQPVLQRTCTLQWPLERFKYYREWLQNHSLPKTKEEICTGEKEVFYKLSAYRNVAVALEAHSFEEAARLIVRERESFQKLYPRFDGREGISVRIVIFAYLDENLTKAKRALHVDWKSIHDTRRGFNFWDAVNQYVPGVQERIPETLVQEALNIVAELEIDFFLIPGNVLEGSALASVRAALAKSFFNKMVVTNVENLQQLQVGPLRASLQSETERAIKWSTLDWDSEHKVYSYTEII